MAVQREKEEAQAVCLSKDRELNEERRLMKELEGELCRLKEEVHQRRLDEEQVHSILKQARTAVHHHSRKPSSLNSVTSFNSVTSSAYSDEQKEADQADDPFLSMDPTEAAIKETQRCYVEALREIEALEHLRREDEAKIEEAIRQLRSSREQVCKDYEDMIRLSQQLNSQQRDIETLQAELKAKDDLIAQLRADRVVRATAKGSSPNASFDAVNSSDPFTESQIVGELAEFEGRYRALQAAMAEKEGQVTALTAQLRLLQTECKELRDYIGMQEGTIRRHEKQLSSAQQRSDQSVKGPTPLPSPSSSPSTPLHHPSSQDTLMALAEVTKAYRSEQRLRQSLQESLHLPILSPALSPSHSRQTSLGGSVAGLDSPRGPLTPQRLSAAGVNELVWWQQQRRRMRGLPSSSMSSSFTSPANAVMASLAGTFTNEGAAGGTPVRDSGRRTGGSPNQS